MKQKTKIISRKLKALRLYLGYKKQTDAATALGMSRSQFNLYESGKKEPTTGTLRKICTAFEIDVNYFFNNGKPEHFDLRLNGRKKNYAIPFIETSVSRALFSILASAVNRRECVQLQVTSSGCGVTRCVKEFAVDHPECVVIDALEGLQIPSKLGAKLYVIDHAHYTGVDQLSAFLKKLRNADAGIVVITERYMDLYTLDKEEFLESVSLYDIDSLATSTVSIFADEIDERLHRKLLIGIRVEVFHDLDKIGILEAELSAEETNIYSVFNILDKLEKIETEVTIH